MRREHQILEQIGSHSKEFEMLVKSFNLSMEKCGTFKLNPLRGNFEKKKKAC